MTTKQIALVDCNNFYVSCERVFRPDLVNVPLVVLGVGPTKTLAKLANHVAKKHPRSKGVFNYNDLNEEQQAKLLSQITVDEVWGVGRKLTKRLEAANTT